MENDNSNQSDDKGKKNNNVIKFPGAVADKPAQDQSAPQDKPDNLTTTPVPNKKECQAKALVSLASQVATLFHTSDHETYALIDEDGVQKTFDLTYRTTKFWLLGLVYKKTGSVPSASSLKTAIRFLKAKALFDGPESEVHLRYASHGGCIYIDLGNENWEQAEISPDDYRVIAAKNSPIKFRRENGIAAMCHPAEKGSFEPLRDILNLENEGDFKLIIGWLIGAMNPTGPFPIMTFVGEQGSAKSTTARLLKELTDPATIDLVALPRNERELAIAAQKTWTLPYDNLSKISGSMSDAFCRLATGGGFRTRTLYTNDSEILFTSARPVIMNGISDFITRQDLADRSIVINLAPIPKHKRITEKQLQKRWNESKPLVFGALCGALSMALRNSGRVNLPEYPRMADFAQLVSAAEPALPWKKGEFLEAYLENIKRVVDISIEADDVAMAVIDLIDRSKQGGWMGKPTELREALDGIVDIRTRRLKSWPKQANALSGRLNRCSTFLRTKGIEIERGKSGDRYISIRKIESDTVQTAHIVLEKQPKEKKSDQLTFESYSVLDDSDDLDDEFEEGEI